MRHRLHRLALSFALALAFLGQAAASLKPLGSSTETVYRRQAAGSPASETVVMQTVQTIETNAGPATETCVITFTPVTGARGEPLVQVVRQCNVVPGAAPQSTSSSLTSTTSQPASTTSVSSTSTTNSLSSAQSTSTTTSASSSVSSAIVFSSVPITPVPSPSSSTPTSSVTSSSPVFSPAPVPTTSPSPTATSSTPNGVTAADSASSSASASAQAAFQIPGKKISVLPIGLGIFAGISVIALIVVGLVTYERTKYRKIFRQRKLAEQGERMGYNGLP